MVQMISYIWIKDTVILINATALLILSKSNKQMGCNESSTVADKPIKGGSKDALVVASLNYCGIMNSPFEFYVQ